MFERANRGVQSWLIDFDESWSFKFENYGISHQGNAVIDLTVSYDYVDGIGINDPFEYPEFTQIYNFIDNYLVNYPNETDFWEILNKNLVETLLNQPIPTEFGIEYNLSEVVDSLTVDIDVEAGSSGIPIARSITVTGISQGNNIIEIDRNDGNQLAGLVYDFTATKEQFLAIDLSNNLLDLGTDAVFDNIIGFYEIIDTNGGIDTDGDGIADLTLGQEGYAQFAITNRIPDWELKAGATNITVEQFQEVIVAGDRSFCSFCYC